MTDDDPMVANEILLRVLEDRERGVLPDLRDYLRRFAGHEALVRREWAALGLDGDAADGPGAPVRAAGRDALGRYRLHRELGRGGQAVVFEAVDERLGRRVALKVFQPRGGVPLGDALRRFQREAELVARLDHPAICPVYDVGHEDGRVYIAMRLLAGVPLSLLAAPDGGLGSRAGVEPLPPPGPARLPRVLPWFARIADGLDAAHRAGVVHRDVKPSNVLVTAEGPVLVDFGLARDDEGDREHVVTRTGDVLGTPAYMAPEQILGEPLDARADVHALGVSLYECITGRRPFEGRSAESLFRAVLATERPSLGTSLSLGGDDLVAVLETALAREPARRYESAAALADDLRALAAGRRVGVRRATPSERVVRWIAGHPRESALAAALLAGTLALTGTAGAFVARWPAWRLGREQAERDAVESRLAEAYSALLDGAPAVALFQALFSDGERSPEVRAGLALALDRDGRREEALRLLPTGDDEGTSPGLADVRDAIADEFSFVRSPPAGDPVDHFLRGVLASVDAAPRGRDAFDALRRAAREAPEARWLFDAALARAAWSGGGPAEARLAAEMLAVRWPARAEAAEWARRLETRREREDG